MVLEDVGRIYPGPPERNTVTHVVVLVFFIPVSLFYEP